MFRLTHFVIISLVIIGCSDDKANPEVSTCLLNGEWSEAETAGIQFAGSHHSFIIDSASSTFQLQLTSFTDALDVDDPCSPDSWTDYYSGDFNLNRSGGEISFNGILDSTSINLPDTICDVIIRGPYNQSFEVICLSDTLVLSNLFDQISLIPE